MTERTREAYRIVINDILNRDIDVLLGRYDGTLGKKEYMLGVLKAMDFIASHVSELDRIMFTDLFLTNMLISEENSNK